MRFRRRLVPRKASAVAAAAGAPVGPGPLGAGAGVVDDELAAVEFGAVELALGFLGRFGGGHLDEAEAAALEDVDRGNLAVLREQLFQRVFGGPEVEVAHIELCKGHSAYLLSPARTARSGAGPAAGEVIVRQTGV